MTFPVRALHVFFVALLLAASAATIGAPRAEEDAAQSPMLLPVDETPLAIMRDGRTIASFDIEIADDASERSRGLMFRTEFPGRRAMLFVFDETRPVSFWMKNTPRPLDMLFVGEDGELKSIARNTTPFSVASVPSNAPVRFVVEVNAGIAGLLGLQPGDRFVHPKISGRGE